MTLRRKIGVAAFACGALFFGCKACTPVSASAAETRTLTPSQTRALLGDTLTMTYFDGSDYQTAQLTYATNTATKDNTNDFGYNTTSYNLFGEICPDGTRYLVYYATIPDIVPTVAYPTVQITPTIQFNDVSLTKFILGFSAPASGESSQYNFVEYYVNGNRVVNHVFYTDGSPTSTAFRQDAKLSFTINNNTRYFMCAPVYYNSTAERGYIDDITYKQAGTLGTDVANGYKTIRFIISCPTLSDVGSVGSTSGGGTIGGDIEATNRKLDVIIQLLNQIAENTEDDDSSFDSPSQLIVMPVWLDAALLRHEATFDIDIDGSIIFGLTPEHADDPSYPTAGGQVFLPSESGVDRIAADPSNGGIMQGMGLWSTLLKSLLGTNPLMSKLITMFLGLSVVTWLLYYRKGG